MSPWSRSTAGAVLAALVLAAGASACDSDSATGADGQSAVPSPPAYTEPVPPPPPPRIKVERNFPVPGLERLPSRTTDLAGHPWPWPPPKTPCG